MHASRAFSGRPQAGVDSKATLSDVAAAAGVSTATASRSLRGGTAVAAETRSRVVAAAKDLSYARTLESASSGAGDVPAVAIIAPFVTRWYFGRATEAALSRLRAHGVDVLLYHLGDADARDLFFSRLPLAGRVRAVITLAMPLTDEHTLALRLLGLPIVSIGASIDGAPSVGIDDTAVARAAVDHLLNLGHRQIGLVSGQADDERFSFQTSTLRRQGYADALHDAGVAAEAGWVAAGPHGIDGGRAAMVELLARPELPTAVLAEYDELAIGAIDGIRRAGLRVPEDVAVIGIDDHEMSAVMGLTTMAQDISAQGHLAAGMVLQLLGIEGGTPPSEAVLTKVRLVLRGSTAPPRSA